MFKNLLVILVVWCETWGCAFAQDTSTHAIPNADNRNWTAITGYLAIINSEEEEQLLLRLMRDNKISDIWLGVHDLYQEGEWITVNGEALEETGYSKWTTKFELKQPDGGYHQNCAHLVAEGGMDDDECHDAYAFFCEMAA